MIEENIPFTTTENYKLSWNNVTKKVSDLQGPTKFYNETLNLE